MRKTIGLLGLLLCMSTLGWGQKASVMIMVEQEHVSPGKTGMVVRYCEYAKYEQAKKQGKEVVWDSVGTVAKPVLLTKKSKGDEFIDKDQYIYVLKGLKFNTQYILEAYLVNGSKNEALSLRRVVSTAENDEDPSNMPLIHLRNNEIKK